MVMFPSPLINAQFNHYPTLMRNPTISNKTNETVRLLLCLDVFLKKIENFCKVMSEVRNESNDWK